MQDCVQQNFTQNLVVDQGELDTWWYVNHVAQGMDFSYEIVL